MSEYWTDDRISTLTKLWSTAMSARAIAEEMGGGISRSGILGKAHRLKLPAKGPRVVYAETIAARKKKATERQVNWRREKRNPDYVAPEASPVAGASADIVQIVEPLNRTFAEIGNFECRWISNEDMAAPLYCAHPVVEGKSWCALHRRIVAPTKRELSEDEVARREQHGRVLGLSNIAKRVGRVNRATIGKFSIEDAA